MCTSEITNQSLHYRSVQGLVLQPCFPLFPLIRVALSIAMSVWIYGGSTIIFEVVIVKWEWEGTDLSCDSSSNILWTSSAGIWLKCQLLTILQRCYQNLCQHTTFSLLPINVYAIKEWGRTSRQDKYNDRNCWAKKQYSHATQQSEIHLSYFEKRNCFSCKLLVTKQKLWCCSVLQCPLFIVLNLLILKTCSLFQCRVLRRVFCVTSPSLLFTSPVTLIWKLHLPMKMEESVLEICSWLGQ